MLHFQDAFETRKLSLISAFSICMTVPVTHLFPMYFFSTPQNIRRLRVFCFQEIEKGYIGNKWVNCSSDLVAGTFFNAGMILSAVS